MNRLCMTLRRISFLILAFMILIPSIPVVQQSVSADDAPLTLIGFEGRGTSISNPVLYGDPRITLSGYFTSGVTGENLRIKILTNNGTRVEDLASLNPVISGNQFTFKDISLKPGLNEIVFYERVGSVTRELIHFFVQYNNTPLVTELRVNDTLLHDPAVDPTPTLIVIPSTSRLTLTLDGKVKNAESVEVTNRRTGDVIAGEVVNGVLSVKVPSLLGENQLDLKVYNLNKEVTLLNRSILVITTSTGDDQLFYQTSIGGQALSPEQTVTVTGSGDIGTGPYTLTGKELLRYTDGQNQTFDRFTLTITQSDDPSVTENITLLKKADPADPVGFTVVGTPQSGFTQYDLTAQIPKAISFSHGKTYIIKLSYTYLLKDAQQNITPQTVEVTNYPYSFTYVNKDRPRFGSLVNTLNGSVLSEQGENPISSSPLLLRVYTFNMGDANGVPDTSKFQIKYNGTPLSASDYTLSDSRTEDAGQKMGSFLLTLKKLPTGSGRLEITYDDPNDSLPPVTVSSLLRVEITPYVLITYQVGTDTKSLEDGTEITSSDQIRTLNGKVFNYVLKGDKSNLKVELNGQDLTSDARITVDAANNAFTILDTLLREKLATGNNRLKISLTETPETSFSYTIIYFTAQVPEIYDVKLETERNGKVNELVKGTTDRSYRTTALFLRSFQFKVKNATRVYVEKNGKRIIDYIPYESGTEKGWKLTESNEYKTAKQEAALNPDLEYYFVNRNFLTTTTGNPFYASMSSAQYGDLVAEVDGATNDPAKAESLLALFPLTLVKQGTTTYTIVAENNQGTITRYDVIIERNAAGWEVISPAKAKETDPYIVVNANSVPIRIFAENASKVMFGKTEASVQNTSNPDFYYDDALGRMLPKTYYVFETTVPLKPGLNRIPFTVEVGGQTYNDEVLIYNANASISGAEYRDVLGKKTSFAPFDKKIQLTFPKGTNLLSPSKNRAGDEVRDPQSEIFVDVPLYFGIADRTTGQVNLYGRSMEPRLQLDPNFSYASDLFYIDGGDTVAPMGRDPYYSGNGIVNNAKVYMDEFHDRYQDNLVPSNRGTLTLQYDPNIVNATGNTLTVFFNDGSGWQNIGGVVDTGKKTITVPFERFGYYMVMKTRQTFSDVVYHPYARNDMETLYAKGIMPNYSGSSFGANRYITRGEMATILVKALDLPINAGPYSDSYGRYPLEPSFYDVRPVYDKWDYSYKYVETAARAGIIRGKEPGYFRPDENLTRQEAAVMIARAMNLKLPKSPEDALKQLGKAFTDAKDMDYYALQSIAAVTKAGLMVGSPNDPNAKKPTYSFRPEAPLTRAEMAVTVRVMIQMKKLPKP